MNAKISKPLLALGLLGLAAGSYGVVEALVSGTQGTNLGSYVPWGLGVATYLLFLGLSAGGLLLACMTYVFGIKHLDGVSGVVTYATLVAEVCAGTAIALDLGHWERMYRFVTSPSPTSPMFWMFVFFSAVLLVYLLKALAIASGDEGLSRLWSLVSIPVSLGFYGVNGYIFAILANHPAWSGAFTPVWFVLAALLSGGALAAAVAWFCRVDAGAATALGKAVLVLLVLFAAFEALHIVAGYRGGRPDVAAALNAMLCGPGWWGFWVVHAGVGLALPLLMLLSGRDSPGVVAWACLPLIVSMLGFRYAYVVSAQTVPMLPGLDQAWQDPRLALSYIPSLGEWLVVVWVASLGLLGLVLGPRLFPRLFTAKPAAGN